MDHEMTERLKGVLAALLGVLFAGTMGYTIIEGWPTFDSLYMTIITLATIGFGEVHPLSTAGRVFTIVLSLLVQIMVAQNVVPGDPQHGNRSRLGLKNRKIVKGNIAKRYAKGGVSSD